MICRPTLEKRLFFFVSNAMSFSKDPFYAPDMDQLMREMLLRLHDSTDNEIGDLLKELVIYIIHALSVRLLTNEVFCCCYICRWKIEAHSQMTAFHEFMRTSGNRSKLDEKWSAIPYKYKLIMSIDDVNKRYDSRDMMDSLNMNLFDL